jgi:uncharacterized protein
VKLIEELYVLPDDGQFILYAPLKRLILVTNRSLLSLLARIRAGLDPPGDAESTRWIGELERLGLINSVESFPPALSSPEGMYAPPNVTFLPTSDCNLRCIYCYADAGTAQKYLDIDVAKAGLEFVFANATTKGVPKVHVGFLGGGEPFLAWNFVVEIVEYGRRLAQRFGIEAYFTGVTNGVLSPTRAQWIARNFQYLNISIDGPKAIQNEQRPAKDGKGSFDTVVRTLGILNDSGFRYALRTTVSSRSVSELPAIAGFFSKELKAPRIQFEPLFACGRCRTQKDLAPDTDAFVESFKNALAVIDPAQTEMLCSVLRIDVLSPTFCGALADNFYITPDGHVTSCTEVSSADDPLAQIFFIGRYEPGHGFIFFEERRNVLQARTVNNLEQCKCCIAKWHCAGGCAVKAAQEGSICTTRPTANCKIARDLTEHSVRTLARGHRMSPRIDVESITWTGRR